LRFGFGHWKLFRVEFFVVHVSRGVAHVRSFSLKAPREKSDVSEIAERFLVVLASTQEEEER
jgi:hypothetical protein